MGVNTGIAWTGTPLPDGTLLPGFTFNPWIGCARVSPACAHCYADTLASNRMGLHVWDGKEQAPRKMMSHAYWKQPLTWEREAVAAGTRRRVFCASMADVFEDRTDLIAPRQRLWDLIHATPHLDWLLLTKRPEHVTSMVPIRWMGALGWGYEFPDNVWVGTSVENQHWADIRIPALLKIPARVRFLSCEPLLGPVDLTWHLRGFNHIPEGMIGVSYWQKLIHWVIVGGESGPKHRAMNLDWARGIRDQCRVAGVPHFFKQVGGRTSKSGGDLLDGVRYQQFPEVA